MATLSPFATPRERRPEAISIASSAMEFQEIDLYSPLFPSMTMGPSPKSSALAKNMR
jgi:hypothetical protein